MPTRSLSSSRSVRGNAGLPRADHRWFFYAAGFGMLFLFWQILEPYALVLATAAIAAVILAPLERHVQKVIPLRRLSAFIVILGMLFVVVLPLFMITILAANQASDLVQQSIGPTGWLQELRSLDGPWATYLPESVKESIRAVDVGTLAQNVAVWAVTNAGTIFSSTAQLVFNTFLFFIALYYFLLDRKKLISELMALSPLADETDEKIMHRIIGTVRGVVFGALIVSLVQGIFAAAGMTIFGVPGALIWGGLTVIAAQIPIVGVGAVMIPAIGYLLVSGSPAAAAGLAIWSMIVVGLADNVLSPVLIEGKTHMHALLILVSILGGLQYFGPIGLIMGPTVLAGVLVVLELYKASLKHAGRV